MAQKVGQIGDVDPIAHGGGLIFTGPHGPWLEWFKGMDSLGRTEQPSIYLVNLYNSGSEFLDWYDWVDWNDVAGFSGQDVDEYSPGSLRSAVSRALAVEDAAGYYGWFEFDPDGPLYLSFTELTTRWRERD